MQRFVAGSVVVSTFGCNVAGIIAASRTCFAMAADRRFFPPAARVHPVHRTPHIALLITSGWSAFLTLTGGYEALFTYVTFASVLFGTLGGAAIFVLRVRRPDVPRPYRALGYPLIPALYVLGSFALVCEYADGAADGIDCRPRARGAGPAVLCVLVEGCSLTIFTYVLLPPGSLAVLYSVVP